MTTCRPCRPLRCWQYHAQDDEQLIPQWAAAHLTFNEGKVTLDDWTFEEGEWLVEWDAQDGVVSPFLASDFAKGFDTLPTVQDLEAILAQEDPSQVTIHEDGSVTPFPTPETSP